MKTSIGATSYVFRYLLLDAAKAPRAADLLAIARTAGLDRLQVCENARPLELSCLEWAALQREADAMGPEITLGCMTLDPGVVSQYLDRVEAIGGAQLRIVLERDGGGPASDGKIRAFLDSVTPDLQARRLRLAIENHFDIPCRVLAEVVADYPSDTVGFCLDVANSLRKFEDTEKVFDLLGSRALCYHFKDYRVAGSNVGFSVTGTPFGEGQIDTHRLLERVFAHTQNPEIYLETWTPSTGDREADIATDARFLAASIVNLRAVLNGAGSVECR